MNYTHGTLIAKISGSKKKLYVSESGDDAIDEILIDEKFQIVPDPEKARNILYICGSSGSGKSYFTAQYCREYTKINKNNPIYLFSSISADESVDSIKNLRRIDIRDPDFLEEDIELDDLANSLCIFDDTDCITNMSLRRKVQGIADMCLETGRHQKISIIFTNHTACAGNTTKKILNECSSITIFLRSLGGKALKYLLESYLSLDKKQISKLKTMKKYGRALTIMKTYPQVVITERCAYVLSDN